MIMMLITAYCGNNSLCVVNVYCVGPEQKNKRIEVEAQLRDRAKQIAETSVIVLRSKLMTTNNRQYYAWDGKEKCKKDFFKCVFRVPSRDESCEGRYLSVLRALLASHTCIVILVDLFIRTISRINNATV
jgi:hypothetical protein